MTINQIPPALIEPYPFGTVVTLTAGDYCPERQAVLCSEGVKVFGNNDLWRYYVVTLDAPYYVFKTYTSDFAPVEPRQALTPEQVGELRTLADNQWKEKE